MTLIVFSHANSFPAATYGVLFKSLRSRGFTVKAVDKYGHDPEYPVTNNWPHLVQQLADFAAPEIEQHGDGAWLVGHSLGGGVAIRLAAQRPDLVIAWPDQQSRSIVGQLAAMGIGVYASAVETLADVDTMVARLGVLPLVQGHAGQERPRRPSRGPSTTWCC